MYIYRKGTSLERTCTLSQEGIVIFTLYFTQLYTIGIFPVRTYSIICKKNALRDSILEEKYDIGRKIHWRDFPDGPLVKNPPCRDQSKKIQQL